MAIVTIPRVPSEPDALPSLFNDGYAVIDANFSDVDDRVTANTSEINAARGPESSIGARLNKIDINIIGLDPDMQNMVNAALMQAMQYSSLANWEIVKTLKQRFQTGTATIYNRGVIKGTDVTIGSGTRNLDIASGTIFIHGRIIPVSKMLNSAVVPQNDDFTNPAFCYSYVYLDGNGVVQHDCTSLGQEVPENGLKLYKIDMPANSTEQTDPNLTGVTFTDQRRVEAEFPMYVVSAAFIYIPLEFNMLDAKYEVSIDIDSFQGSGFQKGYVYITDRLANGFKIYTNGSIDKIILNWTAKKLSL